MRDAFHVFPHAARRRGRAARALCAVAAAVALPLVAGCGDDNNGPGESGSSPSPTGTTATGTASPTETGGSPEQTGRLTEDQAERRELVPKAEVGYAEAAKKAVGEVSGGKLVSIELKGSGNGEPVWEAGVAEENGTLHEIRIDATGGKVTGSRAEPDQDRDDKRERADLLKEAEAGWQDAVTTATDRKNGTVTSVELDNSDGGTDVWSVDVVTRDDWNKTTYDINASTGKVEREHVDRD